MFEPDGFKADRDRRRNAIGSIRRLVQRRAVEPHDVLAVVLELGDAGVAIEIVDVMRREVAVGDRVVVLVSRARLVNVGRRERRCKDEKGPADRESRQATHGTSHIRIIGGTTPNGQWLGGQQSVETGH
jgi:hypothetical protein